MSPIPTIKRGEGAKNRPLRERQHPPPTPATVLKGFSTLVLGGLLVLPLGVNRFMVDSCLICLRMG